MGRRTGPQTSRRPVRTRFLARTKGVVQAVRCQAVTALCRDSLLLLPPPPPWYPCDRCVMPPPPRPVTRSALVAPSAALSSIGRRIRAAVALHPLPRGVRHPGRRLLRGSRHLFGLSPAGAGHRLPQLLPLPPPVVALAGAAVPARHPDGRRGHGWCLAAIVAAADQATTVAAARPDPPADPHRPDAVRVPAERPVRRCG